MAQEKLLSDFSGGMNALAAVDKLDPKECLLAENVRLDETGNIQSAGAFTHQNPISYVAGGGGNNKSIHSLYWNPALGGVAGVGMDVFMGPTLGSFVSALVGQNPNSQKMSFTSAPGRVYFDVGSVGYWTDLNNLLTVDWPPPSASSAVVTGPNGGTVVNSNTTNGYGFSISSGSVQGITSQALATASLSIPSGGTCTVTLAASLLIGGSPVGGGHTVVMGTITNPSPSTITPMLSGDFFFGNANDTWGYKPNIAQVNDSSFGILYTMSISGSGILLATLVGAGPTITIFQAASGFVAGTGAIGTLTGTYSWKVTFVAANGEESDGSADSIIVALSGQQGTLTAIPTGDARTVARNIYRIGDTTGTPLTQHYLVGSIPDNVTTVYSDNLTDIAAITEGVILAGDVPGDYPNSRLGNKTVRYPCYHYDRVFWVNQLQQNQIIWSKPLNGFAYPAINFFNVGDSNPVVRVISIFGELIIFKTNGIWRLTGSDETSFDLTQTPSSVGTDEPFSIVALPDKVLFANRYGLWVFNGYTSQPLTTKLDLWFKQEDRSGKSLFGANGFHPPEVVSPTVPMNFDACGNSEKFYLAYAEAGQPQNNALLVFDVKHGNVTKREPGTPLPLSLAIDPVTGYVYMGDATGFISLMDDWNGATGGGLPINFDFQHGYQDFQRGSNKALWALEFYINTNGQSITPYVYYDNGAAFESLAAISTTSLQRVVRPVEATNARKMQNFSFRLNGSVNPVNVSGTPAIQLVHVKALYDLRAGRARTGQ